MIKKLSKHGNSLALVIEKPILDLLNIDADTELEVTTDGHRLIVSCSDSGNLRNRFDAAVKNSLRKYSPMYERLAK